MMLPVIDKNSYIPAYIQIKDHFLHLIETNELKLGDKIPPENEIVHMSGLSRMTVRQGIQQLVQQGYLRAQRGLGTFVTVPAANSDTMNFTSLSKQAFLKGKKLETKVLIFEERLADTTIAKKLRIKSKTPVWYCERIRYADGQPIIYEISYIVKELFHSNISKKDLESSNFEWISQKSNNTIAFAQKEFSAVTAGKNILEFFTDLNSKSCLIQMDITSVLNNHEVFDYSVLYYHPKNYNLSTIQNYKD